VFTNTFKRQPPPTPGPDPGPDAKPAQQRADLAATKHPSTRVATRGDTVTFRLTVTNRGPDHASRVVLHDQLFGSAQLVSIHADRGSCSHSLPVVCQLGTLSPHAKAHVTVRLQITSRSSRFADRAVVGAATQDPRLANNVDSASVRVVRPPTQRLRRHKPRFTG
jgi:uncharacterized repeat protein (TIGR01451 family)